MPESRPPPIALHGLTLAELQTLADARRLPQVEQWHPTRCGHSDMRIARDGTWYHQGKPIGRPAMVRLFATILRREADGRHVLVTPVEMLDIDVESTAFRAIELSCEGDGRDRTVALRLDSGDVVIIGEEHPLSVVETEHGPSPRVAVRHGLEAELSRRSITNLPKWRLPTGVSDRVSGATARFSRWAPGDDTCCAPSRIARPARRGSAPAGRRPELPGERRDRGRGAGSRYRPLPTRRHPHRTARSSAHPRRPGRIPRRAHRPG